METFLIRICCHLATEDEKRVDLSARQPSQTHSQGNTHLDEEKENKAARMAQSITRLESN